MKQTYVQTDYEKIDYESAEKRLLVRIEIAEREFAQGKIVDGETFRKEMSKRYGFWKLSLANKKIAGGLPPALGGSFQPVPPVGRIVA